MICLRCIQRFKDLCRRKDRLLCCILSYKCLQFRRTCRRSGRHHRAYPLRAVDRRRRYCCTERRCNHPCNLREKGVRRRCDRRCRTLCRLRSSGRYRCLQDSCCCRRGRGRTVRRNRRYRCRNLLLQTSCCSMLNRRLPLLDSQMIRCMRTYMQPGCHIPYYLRSTASSCLPCSRKSEDTDPRTAWSPATAHTHYCFDWCSTRHFETMQRYNNTCRKGCSSNSHLYAATSMH